MQSNRFTYEMKIKQKQTEYLSTNKIKTKTQKQNLTNKNQMHCKKIMKQTLYNIYNSAFAKKQLKYNRYLFYFSYFFCSCAKSF